MDFDLKTYKHLKIRYYFKAVNCFFFFHGTSLKNENWIKIEQILVAHKLKYFRIFNKIMIKTLKSSIFKNLIVLIHGPIILLNGNNADLTLKDLENISPLISLLGFRLNNKIYSRKQIKNLKKVSYIENVFGVYSAMKVFTKIPYYKFKSRKALYISK